MLSSFLGVVYRLLNRERSHGIEDAVPVPACGDNSWWRERHLSTGQTKLVEDKGLACWRCRLLFIPQERVLVSFFKNAPGGRRHILLTAARRKGNSRLAVTRILSSPGSCVFSFKKKEDSNFPWRTSQTKDMDAQLGRRNKRKVLGILCPVWLYPSRLNRLTPRNDSPGLWPESLFLEL